MDELRDQIRSELAKVSDGNLFEECVGIAFTNTISGFTPVSGPGDFGRDGEIPAKEVGCPLACTIQENLKANVLKTTRSYKKSGGKSTFIYATGTPSRGRWKGRPRTSAPSRRCSSALQAGLTS